METVKDQERYELCIYCPVTGKLVVFPCHSLYSTSLLHHVKRAPVLRPGRWGLTPKVVRHLLAIA